MIGSRSITRRVALAFSVIVAISAATSFFVVHQSVMVRAGVDISVRYAEIRTAVARFGDSVDEAHRALLLLINSSDIANLPDYEEAVAEVDEAVANLEQVAVAAGGVDGDETMKALSVANDAFAAWRNGIAARQIADLDDPSTVDLARLREVSKENRALWATIDRTLDDLLIEIEAHLEVSARNQDRQLSLLLVAAIVSGVVVVLAATAMALLLSRTVTHPLRELAAATERLKDRDWSVVIPSAQRHDEIGLVSRALEVFRENGRKNEALEAEHRRDAEEKLRQAAIVNEAVAHFRTEATGILREVDSAGQSLGSAAVALEDVAGMSHTYTTSVSRAAEATGTSVDSVASAVEEMSASIREISTQMQNVSRLTRDATSASEAAGHKVEGLQKMSDNINSVIGLINGIAGQINLLALNATIESARAGEAGKGFAVVASQVKQLADQTAKATEEITRVIAEVRGEIAEVVSVIGRIGGSISEVSSNCATVAAAVEEQSAAMDEISQNVSAVSTQTLNVANNVRGVEEKVSETRRVAGTVSELSAALKISSDGLSTTIERFIFSVANDRFSADRVA
jgi:methyl-accepting chemotaxis protein